MNHHSLTECTDLRGKIWRKWCSRTFVLPSSTRSWKARSYTSVNNDNHHLRSPPRPSHLVHGVSRECNAFTRQMCPRECRWTRARIARLKCHTERLEESSRRTNFSEHKPSVYRMPILINELWGFQLAA